MASPQISNSGANQEFRDLARHFRLDPDNPWIGGYVDYEWEHARYLFEALEPGISGCKVLEFGCNVGASAIVLSHLNAKVTALEVEQHWLDLAQLNARRYGVESDISFIKVADSRQLPFADNEFELIVCNSVLEYVHDYQLGAVQRELDRVLKPGGRILITGTSNRLFPLGLHGRIWLVNYVPSSLDRWLFKQHRPERGVWPWKLRYGFGDHYIDLDCQLPQRYQEARLALMPSKIKKILFKTLSRVLNPFGITPNWLSSSIAMTLQKKY